MRNPFEQSTMNPFEQIESAAKAPAVGDGERALDYGDAVALVRAKKMSRCRFLTPLGDFCECDLIDGTSVFVLVRLVLQVRR